MSFTDAGMVVTRPSFIAQPRMPLIACPSAADPMLATPGMKRPLGRGRLIRWNSRVCTVCASFCNLKPMKTRHEPPKLQIDVKNHPILQGDRPTRPLVDGSLRAGAVRRRGGAVEDRGIGQI